MTTIPRSAPISIEDLQLALDWASDTSGTDAMAYVCRSTGRIYMVSTEHEDPDMPEDIDDEAKYPVVPSRHDLRLGRRLAVRFAQEQLPERVDDIYDIFSKRGAYSRFKDMLQQARKLDDWYAFEDQAVVVALREWADVHELTLAER
jgi:hypothetical protein